jgi:hypothetical protein
MTRSGKIEVLGPLIYGMILRKAKTKTSIATMRDDGEDGDRDQKGDKDKEAMHLWNKGN